MLLVIVFGLLVTPEWASKLKKINAPFWLLKTVVLLKYFVIWPAGYYYAFSFVLPEYAALLAAFFCGYATITEGISADEKEILYPTPIVIYLSGKVKSIFLARPRSRE